MSVVTVKVWLWTFLIKEWPGKNQRKRTRKQHKKDEYINQCMADYKNGTITSVQYVKKRLY